jgi:hypothetical protein
MTTPSHLLLRALADPSTLSSLDNRSWSGVISIARGNQVLGRLAELAAEGGILPQIPDAPRKHLEAARLEATKFHRDLLWELRHVERAFAEFPCRPILLKGSSYLVGRHRARLGRRFGDLDILVPRQHLDTAERALSVHGWVMDRQDRYDSFYYRQWTHQLPPMRHIVRQSSIDLHHSLRPPLGIERVDMAPFFEEARRTETGFDVPSPACMVVHSAAHLFCNGDFRNALRDLSDIDLLLREFGDDGLWWHNLFDTAGNLHLVKPLALAMVHSHGLLGTPIPPDAFVEILRRARRGPRHPIDRIFAHAIRPPDGHADWVNTMARWALFVRGYIHDMPPHILALHLGHRLYTLARDGLLPAGRVFTGKGERAE